MAVNVEPPSGGIITEGHNSIFVGWEHIGFEFVSIKTDKVELSEIQQAIADNFLFIEFEWWASFKKGIRFPNSLRLHYKSPEDLLY